MNAVILNGKEIAAKRLQILTGKLAELSNKGVTLSLATVRVGDSKDTLLYSKSIENLLRKLNIRHAPTVFDDNISQNELIREIV